MLIDALLPFVPAVIVLTTVGSTVGWVALDAASRGANPWLWALVALVTYPVFFLTLYVLRRRHDRVREPGRRYVATRTVVVGSLVAVLAVALLDRYWFDTDDRVTV